MASTTSQNNPLTLTRMATGAYIEDSSAAAFTITCGFTPRYVKVFNETGGHYEEWNENMANAEALKTTEDTGTVDIAMITSNGITPVTNSGFTVGLDTDINVVNEQMSWIAFG